MFELKIKAHESLKVGPTYRCPLSPKEGIYTWAVWHATGHQLFKKVDPIISTLIHIFGLFGTLIWVDCIHTGVWILHARQKTSQWWTVAGPNGCLGQIPVLVFHEKEVLALHLWRVGRNFRRRLGVRAHSHGPTCGQTLFRVNFYSPKLALTRALWVIIRIDCSTYSSLSDSRELLVKRWILEWCKFLDLFF